MNEKQGIKISLSTFFLIIAIIVIVIMGYFIYKFYNDKQVETSKVEKLSSQINNLEDEVNNLQSTTDSKEREKGTNSISFAKLMDMMYPKSFTENSTKYTPNIISDVNIVSSTLMSGKMEIQMCGIYADQESNSIDIRICDTANSIDKNYILKGINEEIVSIVVLPFEGEAIPNDIYVLTRNGNIYYANNMKDSTAFTNLNATKIKNISNIVSISSISVIDESAYEAYATVIATTYDGEQKNLADYIEK